MKHINLNSLIESYGNLNEENFKNYLELFGIKFDDHEMNDLSILSSHLFGLANLDNFYVGYNIKQINKEFDLLRFGTDEIVNIELKSNSTAEKNEKQLKQNRYYLEFLGKTVYTFTFISETEELFQYDDTETLQYSDLETLISILQSQTIEDVENIDSLFKPSNYLVSPFNSTERFINGEYFLTQHQTQIKNNFINLFNHDSTVFTSILGTPGTGKTLLTYDIVNDYKDNGYRVAIIHCANLNEGHTILKETYQWKIYPIKSLSTIKNHSFDVLIVDEAQRLREEQLELIESTVKSLNAKCIFSYDPDQCFTEQETMRNIGSLIEDNLSSKTHRLTKKIRTNKEIGSFIVNLFNLNKVNPNLIYSNINVQFFSDPESAKNYADNLTTKGWNVINFTNSLHYRVNYDQYQTHLNKNSHAVIGQEYDNVVVFIDEHFYYDTQKRLRSHYVRGGAYAIDKMLYQNITRARERLNIIVVNNEEVLIAIAEILKRSELGKQYELL